MRICDKALKKLRNTISNLSKNFQSRFIFYKAILSYNSDINECIQMLYITDDFKDFADILLSIHSESNSYIQVIVKNQIMLDKWDQYIKFKNCNFW